MPYPFFLSSNGTLPCIWRDIDSFLWLHGHLKDPIVRDWSVIFCRTQRKSDGKDLYFVHFQIYTQAHPITIIATPAISQDFLEVVLPSSLEKRKWFPDITLYSLGVIGASVDFETILEVFSYTPCKTLLLKWKHCARLADCWSDPDTVPRLWPH